MNRSLIYIVLLLICILSRLISGINYFEDYESLLVSVDVNDANFLNSYKNFSSPLFISFIKLLSLITDNVFLSFSFAGGISVFAIIYCILSILNTPLASLEGGLVSFLIFFNPLIWVASNRFTPELMGTALSLIAFYFLITEKENNKVHLIGAFFAGFVGGVFMPYMIFLILPLVYSILKKDHIIMCLLAFAFGVSMWFVPVIVTGGEAQIVTYFKELFLFNSNDHSLGNNIITLIRDLWALGLSGFWLGRSLYTVFLTLALIPCLFFGVMILLSFEYNRLKLLFLFLSGIIYITFIVLTRRYNGAALTIIMPFLMIIISYGIIYFLVNFNMLIVKGGLLIFLISQAWIGIYFAREHKKPAAVQQLSQYIFEKKRNAMLLTNEGELNHYLQLYGINSTVTSNKTTSYEYFVATNDMNVPGTNKTIHFNHNPLVNSRWSQLVLYEY